LSYQSGRHTCDKALRLPRGKNVAPTAG
jgi:hypothetical protein